MRGVEPGSKGGGVIRSPLNTGIQHIYPYHAMCDYAGREATIATFGEQIVGFNDAEILTAFNYFINPERLTTTSSSGDFSITSDNSRLKITVGAASAPGVGITDSINNIIYRPGYDAYCICTTVFTTPASGTTQEFGPHDDLNGYAISMEQDGTIAVNHYRAGSLVTKTLQKNFILDILNGTGLSKFNINPFSINIYRFNYGYLGSLPASFEVYGGTNIGWIPFHYIDITGLDDQLIIDDPYLPMRYHVTSDGTNEITIYSGSWQGGSIGPPRKRWLNDQFATDHFVTGISGVGNIPILSLRNETTFKTKINKIPVDLDTITASVDGNKIHTLRLLKNGNLTAPSFNPVDSSSVISSDTAATAITGGRLLRSYPLGKVDSLRNGVVLEEGEVRMFPGDIISLVVETTSVASDISAALHWDELK